MQTYLKEISRIPLMSIDEEKELELKLIEGDKKAKEEFINKNLRLVVSIVKKYINKGLPIEDLIEEGNIGLIKAVNTFDVSRNIKFSTYATVCINNEILMFLRKIPKKEVSIDNNINTDYYNVVNAKDILISDVDLFEDYTKKETYLILRNMIEELPYNDREIIKLFFGFYNDNRYNQTEIAKKLNVTQSYISRRLTKILKKLKSQLNFNELISENQKVIIKK